MAILKTGSSWGDFKGGDISTGHSHTTIAGDLAPYATVGMTAPGVTGKFLDIALDAPVSALWVCWYADYTAAPTDGSYIILSGGGVDMVRMDLAASATVPALELWDGVGWVQVASAGSITQNQLNRHEMRFVANDTTGVIEYYIGGVLQCSFSGDTIRTAQTTVDTVHLCRPNSAGTFVISGIIIADEDTRALVYTGPFVPTAEGGVSGFTGAYTAVDDLHQATVDSDFVTATVAGTESTYGTGGLNTVFNSGYAVVAVAVVDRAAIGTNSPINGAQAAVRSGTAMGYGAIEDGITTVPQVIEAVFPNDPATAAAWTVSAASSAQPGARAQA